MPSSQQFVRVHKTESITLKYEIRHFTITDFDPSVLVSLTRHVSFILQTIPLEAYMKD
jgi:hypothetical protein